MDALQHEVTVACDQQRAFDLFTTGMGTWWDPDDTPEPATFTGIDVEPRVDGVVAMCHGGEARAFGRVLVWNPPEAYAQSFWLSLDPAHPTRVDATFIGVEGVCTVQLVHGGWTEHHQAEYDRYSAWPHLLGRFAEAAARLR